MITGFTDNVNIMLVVELVVVFVLNFATLSKNAATADVQRAQG